MQYKIIATESEDFMDNYIYFYKENNKVWIRIGSSEERGFTRSEVKQIVDSLQNCLKE